MYVGHHSEAFRERWGAWALSWPSTAFGFPGVIQKILLNTLLFCDLEICINSFLLIALVWVEADLKRCILWPSHEFSSLSNWMSKKKNTISLPTLWVKTFCHQHSLPVSSVSNELADGFTVFFVYGAVWGPKFRLLRNQQLLCPCSRRHVPTLSEERKMGPHNFSETKKRDYFLFLLFALSL